MLAVLAGLLLAAPQDTLQSPPAETVRLAGREVPIVFPTGPVSVPPLARTVSVGARTFAVLEDGQIGPLLDPDGWSAVARAYETSKAVSDRAPFAVKVLVFTRSFAMDRGADGVVHQRRAALTDEDTTTVLGSVALLKALTEAATGGALAVRVDVEIDEDPVVDLIDPSERPWTPEARGSGRPVTLATPPDSDFFGPGFVARAVAPRINDGPFEADGGSYVGPYDSVIVVHAGMTHDAPTFTVDSLPVTLIPFFGFSRRTATEALPVQLLEVVRHHIGLRAGASFQPVLTGAALPLTPGLGVPAVLASLARQPRVGPLVLSPVARGALTPAQDGRVDVRADLALALGPGEAPQWVPGSDGVRLRRPTLPEDTLTATTQAARQAGPLAVGDLAWRRVEDAQRGPVDQVTKSAGVARGGVALPWEGPSEAAGLTLQAWVRVDKDESWAFNVYDALGALRTSVVISGRFGVPAEVDLGQGRFVRSPVAAADEWREVSVPLLEGGPVGRIEVGAPAYGDRRERTTAGDASIWVAGLTIRPTDAVSTPEPTPSPLAPLKAFTEPLTDEQWGDVERVLRATENETRLTGLSVFWRVRDPRALPILSEYAGSGFPNLAWSAVRALDHQGTPEALARLREIVERGPFETNRRFAAETFVRRPEPAMAASLLLMTSPSWNARFEGLRALGAIPATNAQILLSATLTTEPDAAARAQACRSAAADVEIVSRKLLYLAVNDPSQWVRTISLTKLVDSKVEAVRDEALRTRDEAPSVRLALMAHMAASPKEHYRPALRLGVADPEPAVRAAALTALAAAPGPVTVEEVANVLRDPDPAVKSALRALAAKKGLTLP